MTQLFSKPKIPTPPAPVAPATLSDAEVQAKREQERRKRAIRIGRQETINLESVLGGASKQLLGE